MAAQSAKQAQSHGGPPHGSHGGLLSLERDEHALADRLPDLLVDARRISQTVAHGIHGRRRAGTGETFWQFRQYQSADSAQLIDWRRSASSDHLFVREREWEAAHTMWIWPDLSPSMRFKSHLATTHKADRALLLALAAAELLVRGGERVALLGLTTPTASRKATTRMAEAIVANRDAPVLNDSLPPRARIARFSGVLLISDFLDPLPDVTARIEGLAAEGVGGHIVQVLDPAEETLPYDGRAEFHGLEGDDRWIADRVESIRPQYQARLKAHRDGIADVAKRLGWTFLVHHTDRSPAEPLLALVMALQGAGGHYRWTGIAPHATTGGAAT